MVEYEVKELYGGALKTKVPYNLLDASDFRQVPDTQEVFVSPSENESNYNEVIKDDSIIFDLMEALDVKDDLEALKEHFAEISTLNDSKSDWKLINVNLDIKNSVNSSSLIGVGLEPALKWGRKEEVIDAQGNHFKPTLVVVLGLIRLAKAETDVLITYNVLFQNADELKELNELDLSGFVESDNKAYKRIKFAIDAVTVSINEFKVLNWDLFG